MGERILDAADRATSSRAEGATRVRSVLWGSGRSSSRSYRAREGAPGPTAGASAPVGLACAARRGVGWVEGERAAGISGRTGVWAWIAEVWTRAERRAASQRAAERADDAPHDAVLRNGSADPPARPRVRASGIVTRDAQGTSQGQAA